MPVQMSCAVLRYQSRGENKKMLLIGRCCVDAPMSEISPSVRLDHHKTDFLQYRPTTSSGIRIHRSPRSFSFSNHQNICLRSDVQACRAVVPMLPRPTLAIWLHTVYSTSMGNWKSRTSIRVDQDVLEREVTEHSFREKFCQPKRRQAIVENSVPQGMIWGR